MSLDLKKLSMEFLGGYIFWVFFSLSVPEIRDKISTNTILNISKNSTLFPRLLSFMF